VRIVEGLSGTLAEWVRSDEVDFAICNRPATTPGLSLRLLVTDRLVLVSSRNSKLTPFSSCRLADIGSLKLVLPSPNHFLRHTLDHHIDRGDFQPVNTLEIDGQSATLQFVAHSDWSTILPTVALINEFDSHRFTINPIDDPPLSTELYELRSPRRTLTPASEHFISMLEAQLKATPPLPEATA
jgi:DNA-binding transcriptional LysR family regulator